MFVGAIALWRRRERGRRNPLVAPCALDGSDAIDLHIERPVPARDEHEAPGRRILWEIACVDRIDGFEVGRIAAVNGTLYDVFESGTCRRQTQLHLIEDDLDLPFDGKAFDFTSLRIVGRLVGDKNEIAASHGGRNGDLARVDVGG